MYFLQQVSKAVYKGLVSVLKAVIAGLEHSYEYHTPGGMASAFAVLELAHTHYFGKEPDKGGKDSSSGQNKPRGGGVGFEGGPYPSPPEEGAGSSEYLQPGGGGGVPHETHSLNEDNFIAAIGEREYKFWTKFTSGSAHSCSVRQNKMNHSTLYGAFCLIVHLMNGCDLK